MSSQMSPQETAQAVLDKIRLEPEKHDQAFFEMKRGCETTRCVAGWAMAVHGMEVLGGRSHHYGQRLLGLSDDDSENLFYRTNNSQALHAMEYLAKGDAIDWDAVRQVRIV